MKFILQAGNWAAQWQLIDRVVPLADEMDFWGFLMPDHYMWGQDRGGDSTLETWVTLSYLAGKTKRLKLGTLVTPIPFRHPGMLAKEVSTLDLISGGRTSLGVGAGWSQTEFEGYSVWDEPKVRVDKTVEGLELILRLWGDEKRVDHRGRHYSAKGAVLEPKPVQKPHPPLLFGGVGKRMLNLAGRFGDIVVIPPWYEGGFEEGKEVVVASARRHHREDKLSFADLWFGFREKYDRQRILAKVEAAKKGGCEYFIVGFPGDTYLASMEDFAKNVVPLF
jgi:alkanesulfonate monooxygenase SsuD/methylene tetrahydromethanopterin reductase-like flavin-dependent oxidoreductase (luciferase family)